MKILLIFLFTLSSFGTFAQQAQLGLLKYNGGGDWYANLETSLPNLINFCNKNISTQISTKQGIVEAGSEELFNYPFIHLTGHGNIIFNDSEIDNLRKYLLGGGFLHIDDNYGLDKFIRPQMKRVFPELEFVEIPYNHPIYHQSYDFKNGLPKIHEHDNGFPKGYGLVHEGRLICFYSFECDLGDGWEDQSIHNDPQEKRLQALQMGANLVEYVFKGVGLE